MDNLSTRPVNLKEIDKVASNVYEAVILCAKRARVVNDEIKQEYNELVSNIITNDDEFEDKENPDQLRISHEMDKKQKPHLQAVDELLAGKIEYRYKDITE